MCTVTYISNKDGDYILTSSRDESIYRTGSLLPEIETHGDIKILFPKDGEKGGTWIGVTNKNRTLCLLNGAFDKHIPTNDYTKSRGLVVLDFFKTEHTYSFIETYSLKGIEPFTLIIIDGGNKLTLTELKWDGLKKHTTQLNSSGCHIWSSATLYNSEQVSYKSKRFHENITKDTSDQAIFKYHDLGTELEPHLMKYISQVSPIETVSITQIKHSKDKASINYLTLNESKSHIKEIEFNSLTLI